MDGHEEPAGMTSRSRNATQKAQFVVDAALLRELGERLIGRAYIALAELIKNSYDADAINCRVEFGDDTITVTDDGHGISEEEFLAYWMRIGTTHKVQKRISRNLGRSMTGSKGLGRLSVQYLADEIEMDSTSDRTQESLYAFVDWRSVNAGSDLQSVDVLWDTHTVPPAYPNSHPTGTQIVLRGLRSEWDKGAIENLGKEIWLLRSPFRSSSRIPNSRTAQDFYVELESKDVEGANEAFDKVRDALFGNWKARIRGSLTGGRSNNRATVSVEFRDHPKYLEKPERFQEEVTLPISGNSLAAIDRTTFDILIFRPEGQQVGLPVGEMREYLKQFGNVSVYDAGFRLPYYGSSQDKTGHDWLNVGSDQGRRATTSELLPEHLKVGTRYLLDLPAPGRIFGTVEIDTNHERSFADSSLAVPGTWLQIQPGRDRLTANAAFKQLRDLVRFSLDYYASRYRLLSDRITEKRRIREAPTQVIRRAVKTLDLHQNEMPREVYREVRKEVVAANKAVASEKKIREHRAALLAPLATAGITALALNHELARERRLLQKAVRRLNSLADEHSIAELTELADGFKEADLRLSSIQDLFTPLLTDEDRTARQRLAVKPVVQQVVRSMRPLMPGVKFDYYSISSKTLFPVGAFSDWSAVLQNAFANSWNAMLGASTMSVYIETGYGPRNREWIRISDSGVGLGMPLADSNTLFNPFERQLQVDDSRRSLMIGGQGLGLTIVRMIANRRSAKVAFVVPKVGFSTTLELSWQGQS